MLRLLAYISNSALSFIAVLLIFSSQMMKNNKDMLKIPVAWNSFGTPGFSVEGAIYPEEFNGLPLISIESAQTQVSDFVVSSIQRTVFADSLNEKLDFIFPKNAKLLSLNKLMERGSEVTFLEIFPIQYDSISGKYYKIDYLEMEILKETHSALTSNLRTGESSENSVLTTGDWYKLPITETGIYKIDYNFLKNMGIKISAINPKKIKILGNGGGMLPQKISDERPNDLMENAIQIVGEADGKFDQGDYILFYGQEADHKKLIGTGELDYKKNFYTDTCYYYLTVSSSEGLRITVKEDLGSGHPIINRFDDYIIHEKDEYNIINSGREWYGEKFDFTLTYDLKFDFPDLVPDTELKVSTSVMGQTYEEASLDLFVNGQAIGQQRINRIVEGSYLVKGSHQIETFSLNTSSLPASQELTVRLSFNPVGSVKSKANLNYLTILGLRKLKLYENQTSFRSLESTENAISSYEIDGGSSAYQIWDVTEPLNPYKQKYSTNGTKASFGAFSAELREFIIFAEQDFLVPEKAVPIPNQNLHGSANVDFLIVTYPGFKSEADRLAELRRNHNGLEVLVVTTDEIYNEYSSGKQDVSAIRDFIKYVYDLGNGENKLQNVLLFGKGSFDYKDRINNNTNFVPIYTARNSLHPINSYSSDDYYGFMDEDEGEWVESHLGNHLLDIGVGRLPVKSNEEASIIVDKLIYYSTNSATYGNWRNELFFIADDGDGNLHQRDADRLSILVDTSYTQFNVSKIYVDAFEQVESSIGEVAPGVNTEIRRSLDKGGLIFNYTGHGSMTRWAEETILNISSISEFDNQNRLPLFVTATCEFGRHDNPKAISGAEYLILNPIGGAIGLLTTARPVFSSTNYTLNNAFYNNVFRKKSGEYLSLGEVFRKTKNQSLEGTVNRNFSLLADPSMTLSYPKNDISLIADENAYQPGDTLKALNKVKLKGQVLDVDGQINSSFNGKLIAKVFDRPSEIQTYGNNNPIMKYKVRDNIIFNGQVSVKAGEFDIEFIVPKNITYDFEKGKVSMYALDESQGLDAGGSDIEFVVGGEGEDYAQDNIPPQIVLFINDTSFVPGGITGPDILLVGKLSDESGISLSNSESGQELIAVLDDGAEVPVNDFYISMLDTYKKGLVTYPFKELSIGKHKIRLKAWDVYNNSSEAEIEFLVVEDANLAIEKLMNFPNPFGNFTRFSFEHNRAGDDLEISIDIFSAQGNLVKQFVFTRENSESRISDLVWDGKKQNGSELRSGVYIFRLSIRSLIDGSKKQANKKLVIIN